MERKTYCKSHKEIQTQKKIIKKKSYYLFHKNKSHSGVITISTYRYVDDRV